MSDKIIDRVRKLFALAQSANEHEAKTAANMASRLLIEHNLSAEEISAEKSYEETEVDEGLGKIQFYHKEILCILRDYFFVELYARRLSVYTERHERRKSRASLVLIGTATNTKIATFVYEFLSRKYIQLWADHKKKTGCPGSFKTAYFAGLTKGLREQLKVTRTQVQEEKGLVIVKDPGLTKFMENMKLSKTQPSKLNKMDAATYQAGVEMGKNLRIAQGLESATQNNKLALGSGK